MWSRAKAVAALAAASALFCAGNAYAENVSCSSFMPGRTRNYDRPFFPVSLNPGETVTFTLVSGDPLNFTAPFTTTISVG